MAVLVEAISVVVRADAILARFPDGWAGFKASVTNATLCADGEIARVGFMSPYDVQSFIGELERAGLRYIEASEALDIAVFDQQRGPMSRCKWAEFGRIDWRGDSTQKIAACRLIGSEIRQVVTPDGWSYEHSLSASFGFLREGAKGTVEFLRREDGVDIVATPLSDNPLFIARTESRPRAKKPEKLGQWWGSS